MVLYKKTLTYKDLVAAGISNVIGAGIFVIIAYVYKYAGKHTWISILLAGLFMSIFSQHYAKLPSIINIENDVAVEYDIIKKISNHKFASSLIYLAVFGLICSSYLVAKSFGNYLSDYIPQIKENIGTIIIISLCYLLNRSGINNVAKWNNILLLIGLGIIILLIVIGFYRIFSNVNGYKFLLETINPVSIKNNFMKIIIGAYLIIFSYVGFELLVKLNNESINPSKDIPKAIKTTMLFTIIVYTLLGLVYSYARNYENDKLTNDELTNDELTNDELNKNIIISSTKKIIYNTGLTEFEIESKRKDKAPLTYAIEILSHTHKINPIISIGGLLFTATTTLLMMLSASRLLQGQIKIKEKSSVPITSLNIILLGISILFIFNISIQTSTIIANMCIVLLMIVVSYAVIKITKKII